MVKLVYGVGINDADYVVKPTVNGIRQPCPYYVRWKSMIERCYSKKVHERQPTYAECQVCEEWLTFSNFKNWMISQDWQGKQLDKDLLVKENRIYSPTTCVFVSPDINNFILHDSKSGATFSSGKYQARFYSKGNRVSLGYFETKVEAEKAVSDERKSYINLLITSQTDDKVKDALKMRYQNAKD